MQPQPKKDYNLPLGTQRRSGEDDKLLAENVKPESGPLSTTNVNINPEMPTKTVATKIQKDLMEVDKGIDRVKTIVGRKFRSVG